MQAHANAHTHTHTHTHLFLLGNFLQPCLHGNALDPVFLEVTHWEYRMLQSKLGNLGQEECLVLHSIHSLQQSNPCKIPAALSVSANRINSLTPAKYLLHCRSAPTESTVPPPQNTCCTVGQRQQILQSHPGKISAALSVSANSLTPAKYLLRCQWQQSNHCMLFTCCAVGQCQKFHPCKVSAAVSVSANRISSLNLAKYLLCCRSVPTESVASTIQNTCCSVGQCQENQQSNPGKIPAAVSVSANKKCTAGLH